MFSALEHYIYQPDYYICRVSLTLKQIDSKGGYYFVICTIPKELRLSGKDKAIRRSTKTKEYREAVRLWDGIEKEIYKTLDEPSGPDTILALAENYWLPDDGEKPRMDLSLNQNF